MVGFRFLACAGTLFSLMAYLSKRQPVATLKGRFTFGLRILLKARLSSNNG